MADAVLDGLEVIEGVEAAGNFRSADEGGKLAAGEAGRVLAAVDGFGESVELAFGEMCGEVGHGLYPRGGAPVLCALDATYGAGRCVWGCDSRCEKKL